MSPPLTHAQNLFKPKVWQVFLGYLCFSHIYYYIGLGYSICLKCEVPTAPDK